MEDQRDSSWLNVLRIAHRLSHKLIHKKRLDPEEHTEDDSRTPLLSSAMSNDNKISKVLPEVEVTAVDPEARSTSNSTQERRREPWWSYIWVKFDNSFIYSLELIFS